MNTKSKLGRVYNWRRDLPDQRDGLFAFQAPAHLAVLPPAASVRSLMCPVYDQTTLGSCVYNMLAELIQFERKLQKLTVVKPSRLFMYYFGRLAEGTVDQDSGTTIRDGFKAVVNHGYCNESLWPYKVERFTQQPSVAACAKAVPREKIVHRAVAQTQNAVKAAIASGRPFGFGISVYESFESSAATKTGVIPMPSLSENFLGGHALTGVEYDPEGVVFMNHWNKRWGDKGFGRLPWAYLLNPQLASDFRLLETVSE